MTELKSSTESFSSIFDHPKERISELRDSLFYIIQRNKMNKE
jgi:hypothetical protein